MTNIPKKGKKLVNQQQRFKWQVKSDTNLFTSLSIKVLCVSKMITVSNKDLKNTFENYRYIV